MKLKRLVWFLMIGFVVSFGNVLSQAQAEEKKLEKATFAEGCFWHTQDVYRKLKGVVSTMVGYAGGTVENPTYEKVCYTNTGHAESIDIIYDPTVISYEQLLDVFWTSHDPTTLNKQGPDVGEQYRSVIFYHTPEQEKLAKASKEKLESSGKYKRPIVTQILPAQEFYKAEEYHQNYFEKKGRR